MIKKRNCLRLEEDVPCELIIRDFENDKPSLFHCKIVNISKGGIQVISETPIPFSSRVYVCPNIEKIEPAMELESRVVWADTQKKKYGLNFINCSKEQENNINEFFKEKILSKIRVPSIPEYQNATLRKKIKLYFKRALEIEKNLEEKPEEWGKFQGEFNKELNSIFGEIMQFEQKNIAKGFEDKVLKLEDLFVKRIRNAFRKGIFGEWSLRKPLGYPGDFKIIDDIYQNNPTTTGYARLFDNYFQTTAICVAVRNRKEDFKKIIVNFANSKAGQKLRVMDIACGSCRGLSEVLNSGQLVNKDIIFDCYDNEFFALEYARNLLGNPPNVNLFKEDILNFVIRKKDSNIFKNRYNLIYSTGLFDYLNNRICTRLIRNLREVLEKDGMMVIANVRDKYSNPTVHCMEWATDWKLIYRTDDEFKSVFLNAGFKENELKIQYEEQGIMQYVIAEKKT
jgi:extracellular factor (EF) 3-hydroxypalmitic acid methyl ester biosynthesis protein